MAEPQKVVDWGVDWLTVTGTTKKSRSELENFGLRLMREETAYGNESRPWSFKGYEGWRSGAVEVGTRSDSSIVRIAGGLAREHFTEAYHTATNCSRIDFQATVTNGVSPQEWIHRQFKRAYRWSKDFQKKPEVRMLWSNQGTGTLYLNKRVSEQFGRIYDKGEQSLVPVFEGAWRAEVEYKGAMAFHQLKNLVGACDRRSYLYQSLHRFFNVRTCQLELNPANIQTIVLHRPASDERRLLEWMRKCVRPSVQRLIAAGRLQEVIDSLELPKSAEASKTKLKRVV
jgi:DNA relaxase NicK